MMLKDGDRHEAVERLLAEEDFAAMLDEARKASRGVPSRSDEDE